VGECYWRHRHQQFLKSLRRLDPEFPKGKRLHFILDHYGTHRHPNHTAWLDQHPRLELHFIPTSSAWLNLVEDLFREPGDKQFRRGAFHSVAELEVSIEALLQANSENPKLFVGAASVEAVLEKASHCKAIPETVHKSTEQRKNELIEYLR
jgi:hypothetical protein